jgi:hypothetical protein
MLIGAGEGKPTQGRARGACVWQAQHSGASTSIELV